jgi:hypothetical protein
VWPIRIINTLLLSTKYDPLGSKIIRDRTAKRERKSSVKAGKKMLGEKAAEM